mmetsp:Transcript_48625/g.135214  ORF Transcript_48625/g.135214 Transcript_48625/m.135214 type:complete len:456 (-) Transcript_48625:300-1667(-)
MPARQPPLAAPTCSIAKERPAAVAKPLNCSRRTTCRCRCRNRSHHHGFRPLLRRLCRSHLAVLVLRGLLVLVLILAHGRTVVQAQGPGATEDLGRRGHDEDARQRGLQGQLALDAGQRYGADLLPHGHTAVQQGHLQRRAHLLALLLGALVQSGNEPEGNGEGPCLRHDGEGHADHGEGAGVPNRGRSQNADDRSDVYARGIHQSRADRRLQEQRNDRQGGDQLQDRLGLASPAERRLALGVSHVRGRALLRSFVALVHGVTEPLPRVEVPCGVANPHEALHGCQVVEEARAALHRRDDVHDRRAGGLPRPVRVSHQWPLSGDQELHANAQGVEQANAQHQLEHVIHRHIVDPHDGEGDEVANGHHEDKDNLHGHLLLLGGEVSDQRTVRSLQDVDRHVHDPVHWGSKVHCGTPRHDVLARRKQHARHNRREQPRKDDWPATSEARGEVVGCGAN